MLIKIHFPLENSRRDLLIKMKMNYGNIIIIVTASIVNGMLDHFSNPVNGSRSQELDQGMAHEIRIDVDAENSKGMSSAFNLENEISDGKILL